MQEMGWRGGYMSEEHKGMVRRMVEGINAGDIENTVDELFAGPPPEGGRCSRRRP
jgi:hypothetical protein